AEIRFRGLCIWKCNRRLCLRQRLKVQLAHWANADWRRSGNERKFLVVRAVAVSGQVHPFNAKSSQQCYFSNVQAPSPESNPNSPSPVNATVVHYTTVKS